MLCIDREVAEKLKRGVASGEINVQGLYEMTSAQRRALWEKYVSPELAKHINSHFEAAMVSKQKNALKKWAEGVFIGKQKKTAGYKSVMDRIENLDKIGVIESANEDAFLEDLAAERLGFTVTAEEVKQIHKRSVELQKLFSQKDEFGLPILDYWVKRKALEDYVDSLVPTHKLKVATSLIGRGNLLFSFKSPVVNVLSNTVMATVNAVERRLSALTPGGWNTDLAAQYVWRVNQIYQKTGYDVSRMRNLSEGQRRRGEEVVHSQGKGKTRAIGRFYEDIVMKQLMGAPDVASSAMAFADFVSIESKKVAQRKGLKGAEAKAYAREVMLDAMSLEASKTTEGKAVRELSIAEAEYTTYTNNGKYSHIAMGFRNLLNAATGDLRIGDLVMPFVKTPANVVQAGIDAAGWGAIEGIYKLPEAIRQFKQGEGAPMREVTRLFVKTGLGFTLSLILAYALDPEDYIPDYDVLSQRQREMVKAKNASYNSIKIGDKYVSLDYMGPLASAFVGIMHARQSDTAGEGVYNYVRGVASQSFKVPGLRETSDLVDSAMKAAKEPDMKKSATNIGKSVFDTARSRAIPAFVGDVAKATDSEQRRTDGNVDRIKGTIPGLRKSLPAKTNKITGRKMEAEKSISTLMFGSRIRTSTDSALLREVERLSDAGEAPAVSNFEYTSGRVKSLKKQISKEKFVEAMDWYGETYGQQAGRLIKTVEYRRAPDDKKKEALDKIRKRVLEATLRRAGYRKSRGLK